jgi:hypothetical protein
MYRFRLPLVNDTGETKTLSYYLASNDIYGVDSLAGVWIENTMLNDRVAKVADNMHWKVFSLSLEPGQKHTQEFVTVPLGSRWGGMIASFVVE